MGNDFFIVKKGYDPQQVDSCISSLESEITSYKKKEQAINQAIVSAQIISEQLISDAKNEAEQIKKQAREQLSKMQTMLDETEEKLVFFQEEYNELISKYLIKFNEEDLKSLMKKIQTMKQSFTLAEHDKVSPYDGTQAHKLSEKAKNQSSDGVSKEEMNSLFNKN